MAADVLSARALNRATLDRQLLLTRSSRAPVDAVRHLVGLQAQNPRDPYLALWSRLAHFEALTLARQLEDRSLVRIVVMRGTIHLVTADDALGLRPLMQPVLDAEIARHSEYASHLVGVELAPVMDFARARLADEPLTGPQLRTALADRFPDLHPAALAYACRCLLPLVQVPPRGVWGKRGQVRLTPVESWVGRALPTAPSIDAVVLRYLAAFGPATAADAATWSRLTGMREVLDRLQPQLRAFHDERGRELFDLPDAPRPDPDTPAPVRFLPEYDNTLLSHADRSRFSSAGDEGFARAVGPYKGTVLVDGQVRAIWHSEHDNQSKESTVMVEHLRLTKKAAAAVEAEARRTARFWHDDADAHDVLMLPLGDDRTAFSSV